MTRAASIVALALLVLSCDRVTLHIGGRCVLNSDCVEPFVCGLDRCRKQCIDSRDCAAGLLCLFVGDQGGICQLPEEAMCTLTSDCTRGLVCRFGTCTTECAMDRDCPPGASCQPDPDEMDQTACIEAIPEACVYNSDCIDAENPFLICSPERTCRFECVSDEDCRDPLRYCETNHRCYPLGYNDGGI